MIYSILSHPDQIHIDNSLNEFIITIIIFMVKAMTGQFVPPEENVCLSITSLIL
jgi:hypothetical protein